MLFHCLPITDLQLTSVQCHAATSVNQQNSLPINHTHAASWVLKQTCLNVIDMLAHAAFQKFASQCLSGQKHEASSMPCMIADAQSSAGERNDHKFPISNRLRLQSHANLIKTIMPVVHGVAMVKTKIENKCKGAVVLTFQSHVQEPSNCCQRLGSIPGAVGESACAESSAASRCPVSITAPR